MATGIYAVYTRQGELRKEECKSVDLALAVLRTGKTQSDIEPIGVYVKELDQVLLPSNLPQDLTQQQCLILLCKALSLKAAHPFKSITLISLSEGES